MIFPCVGWVRDSLSSMALVLELLAVSGRPLSEIVGSLPRYCMIKHKFELAVGSGGGGGSGGSGGPGGTIERVGRSFEGVRIDRSDGVRLDFDDGWVHLRRAIRSRSCG